MNPPLPASTSSSTPSTASRRVPLDKRKRTETSCDKCKSRKQKCRKEPGQDACRYCMVNGIACQTTQPRKKRLYGSVEGLGNRLALLEALVKGLLPEADLSSVDELRQLAVSLGIQLPDRALDGPPGGDAKKEEALSLLPDQQGQVQYIGPASSFSFHLKLRALLGQSTIRQSVLFGRNAADQELMHGKSGVSSIDGSSPGGPRATAPATPTFEALLAAYFAHVHRDFPVLHEASFRDAYERWIVDPGKADPAWLCGFLCVLLLSRRVARLPVPEDEERLWWRRTQTLLPVVAFTSSVHAVQALVLAALHLHNTNHRDACWNLTGTAIRIAFAIGLHQDNVNATQNQPTTELRKRLWWTLYAFEQMQLSSYDRPSAIEHPAPRVDCPNEQILGADHFCPPDYSKCFNRLVVHLAAACRAPKHAGTSAIEEAYVSPLSPAAGVLRDLERWKGDLPQSLRLEALDSSPPAFRRPLLLLHALYHYTVTVLCRTALLARATALSKSGKDSTNTALTSMADACIESGQALASILLQLDAIGKFDPITWFDCWYALQSATMLLLDLVCTKKRTGNHVSYSRLLLSQLADLTHRHLQNPHIPGTLKKFASMVPELHSMANSMNATPIAKPEAQPGSAPAHDPLQPSPQPPSPAPPQIAPFGFHQSTTNSGSYVFVDNITGRYFPDMASLGNGVEYPNTRFDRNTQMSFMDFTLNNIQDWTWSDLGGLLGNEVVSQVPGPTEPGSGPG